MPYAVTLTAAGLQRLRDRRVSMPASLPPGADDDLTPDQRRALLALDAATDERTWASVNHARWAHGVAWSDQPQPTYAQMRARLHRLARDGYLRVSPAGQPPGLSGLLFRMTARGRVAVIDARARWSSP